MDKPKTYPRESFKKKQKPNKSGKITRYSDRFVTLAYDMSSTLGATDVQLSQMIGITKATLYIWKKKYPEFEAAIRQGKDDFDSDVIEKALVRRAAGYETEQRTFDFVFDPDTKGTKRVLSKVVESEVPPDPKSMAIWLYNRRPDRWKNNQNLSITGKDGGPVEHSVKMTNFPAEPATIEEWEAQKLAADAARAQMEGLGTGEPDEIGVQARNFEQVADNSDNSDFGNDEDLD